MQFSFPCKQHGSGSGIGTSSYLILQVSKTKVDESCERIIIF